MATHVLVVHGVGRYDRAGTERKIRKLLTRIDVERAIPVVISSFDWSEIVSPLAEVSRLGKAFLELPYVEPFDSESAAASRREKMTGPLFLASQIVSLLFLPALAFSISFWSPTPILVYVCVNLGTLLLAFTGDAALSRAFQENRTIRRLALIWVWPILNTVVSPIYLGEFALSFIWWLRKFAWLLGLVAFAALLLITRGNLDAVPMALLKIVGFIVGIVVVTWMAYMIPRVIAYFPAKPVCDVVLWMHSKSYREKLRSALNRELNSIRLDKQDSLILFTHSLGSIIALENLMWAKSLPRNLTLVTTGSPLRSLLCYFFPEIFPTPEFICRFLSAKYPQFRWINIYRKFDWIGRSLAIDGVGRGVEMCTEQKLRFHTNYWGDKRVFECVEECINRLNKAGSGQEIVQDAQPVPWVPLRRPVRFANAARFWRDCNRTIRASVVVAALCSAYYGGYLVKRGWDDNEMLRTQGEAAVGDATCSLRLGKSEFNSPVEDQYSGSCDISFLGARRGSRGVHFQKYSALDPIPMTAPQDANLLRCGYEGCKGICGITVRYDPAKPERFLVFNYSGGGLCNLLPNERYGSDDDIFSLLACSVFFALVSIPIWQRTGRFWLESLLGVAFHQDEILGHSVSSHLD